MTCIRPGADMAYEAERLHALVDGLALHALTAERKRFAAQGDSRGAPRHLAELAPTLAADYRCGAAPSSGDHRCAHL
jgi:hypothetical protein